MEKINYPEIGKTYEHYKGGRYEVITMATHTETNEPLVIYRSLHFGSVYARPLFVWCETVNFGNQKRIPRFSKCQ
jgi:hypothetical protein